MADTLEEVVGMKVQNQVRKGILKPSGMIQEIPEGEVVDFITCSSCGANHVADSGGYLELLGNLHVGGGGGLIGNGDWSKHGAPVSYYCVGTHCLSKRVKKDEEDALDSMSKTYLLEGDVLKIVCLVKLSEEDELVPQTRWDVVTKRYDGVVIALLDENLNRDSSNTRFIVPRALMRECIRTDKIKRDNSKRP